MTACRTVCTCSRFRSRQAFTLFEIAISLALMAIGVTTTLLLLPMMLRAQQHARLETIAATVALQITSMAKNPETAFWAQSLEAEKAWQNPTHMDAFDLERFMEGEAQANSPLAGFESPAKPLFNPLPPAIARRLDAENDEIAQILNQGGRLYYLPPDISNGGIGPGPGKTFSVPREGQQLVFGVVGLAQQNCLLNHPSRAWPMHDFWPSPPIVFDAFDGWNVEMADAKVNWPNALLTDAQAFCDAVAYNSPARNAGTAPAALDAAFLLARTFAEKACAMPGPDGQTIPMIAVGGFNAPVMPPALANPEATPWTAKDQPTPYQVIALRWLAFAAARRAGAQTTPDNYGAFAVACHDAGLAWQQRYAAMDACDWGAVRAFQQAGAMDFPLLQYDFFAPALISGAAEDAKDFSWLVSSPRKVNNSGRAWGMYGWVVNTTTPTISTNIIGGRDYGNHAGIESAWSAGPSINSHFTLCDRFAPAERARQLVAWTVDWQSYEDFEETPCAPMDAKQSIFDSRGTYVNMSWTRATAERAIVWRNNTAGRAAAGTGYGGPNYEADPLPDFDNIALVLGSFGADRNGNASFDHGPTPRTTRMRAEVVGRYTFYDPRLFMAVK